ncbi:MAG: hypothetical protein KGJ07_07500, partial [Patescibacteria group bacterium]|nr:hypothetical protein [Patescibacteria group bacterium]
MTDIRETGRTKAAQPKKTREPRESQPLPGRPSARDNFYGHVNYTWQMETSIPSTESRWNAFDIVRHATTERLRTICEASQNDRQRRTAFAEKGTSVQLVRDFYASGMDMDARNRTGITPIQEYLTDIEHISERGDIMGQIARLHTINVVPFFDFMMAEDRKKAGNNAYYVWQGGLGMPDRDYYLKEDMQDKRDAYKQYIATIFRLAGRSDIDAIQAAEGVYAIEHAIAEAHIPQEEERIVENNYHKFTRAQARSEFPNLDFDTYFAQLGVPELEDFIVAQPDGIRKVGQLLQTAPLEDIKNYLTFALLNDMAPALSEDFVSASFAFYGQVLEGQAEQKPLWERVTQVMNGSILNQALGPIYCEKYFDNAAKTRTMEMVEHIRSAFGERIQALDWMSEETKAKALEKLANITFKMGYPDTWIDVSGL